MYNLDSEVYTVFNYYICSFNFLNATATFRKNKALLVLFILWVFVMYIYVLIFINKDKIMTNIFILTHSALELSSM